MKLSNHKTKIVCTIGPASQSREVLEQMVQAGMDVARLNFSHGDFDSHRKIIETVRKVSRIARRRVAILADLPGPKIRIGLLAQEPIEIIAGHTFTLTTQEMVGDANRVSVNFERLPEAVKRGNTLFLNDGFIQLEATRIERNDVECRVVVGGQFRSRAGLNLPGVDLGISAFTERDHACLQFAMEQGVDVISQSFVESAADIAAVRKASAAMGYAAFIIAKIERARALDHMDEILAAADGLMIARGDLGVEIPIEQIALVQKRLVRQANLLGKPVITATQMLESMTNHRRPTRAEATDVANAILDGTDCVMLSGESAMGKYPVESVSMLAKIAETIEPHRPATEIRKALRGVGHESKMSLTDLIALSVETTLERVSPATVIVPTLSGATARSIARFRLPVWVTAVSPHEGTCQRLQLSYGVYPVYEPDHPEDWKLYARKWLREYEMEGDLVVLTEGPSSKHPEANHRMEIINLDYKS